MFKKRKEAANRKRIEESMRQKEEFSVAMTVVAAMEDPAEQLLQLAKIEKDINIKYAAEVRRMSAYSKSHVLKLFSAPTAYALVAAAAAPHVAIPIAAVHFLGGLGFLTGGFLGDAALDQRKDKKIQANIQELKAAFEPACQTIAEMRKKLINDQAEQIVCSPSYEKVLMLPGLSPWFDGAAAKQAENLKKELSETKQKATQRRQRATPAEKVSLKDKYGYLANPFDLGKK